MNLSTESIVSLFGDWLLNNNISIFTFPAMETGERFWILKQPNTEPIGKGKTLLEALENAGISII